MQKLSRMEMATFQGGRNDAKCGISAASTVIVGAFGFLAMTAIGTPIAGISFGLAYARSMYSTLEACSLL